MQSHRIGAAALLLLATACANSQQAGESPQPPSSSAASTWAESAQPGASAPVAGTGELVGEWLGVLDCARIVEALRGAGFDEGVVLESVVGNGLVPGASSADDLADPADPCADSVPREHGHFFTADGAFGSTDHNGQQVDDGTYEIVGPETVRINGTEFGYSVSGDTLSLVSLAPEGCLTFECSWSILVAMAGEPLERAPAADASQGFEVSVRSGRRLVTRSHSAISSAGGMDIHA